jgi:hypothetical protein
MRPLPFKKNGVGGIMSVETVVRERSRRPAPVFLHRRDPPWRVSWAVTVGGQGRRRERCILRGAWRVPANPRCVEREREGPEGRTDRKVVASPCVAAAKGVDAFAPRVGLERRGKCGVQCVGKRDAMRQSVGNEVVAAYGKLQYRGFLFADEKNESLVAYTAHSATRAERGFVRGAPGTGGERYGFRTDYEKRTAHS